MTVNFLVCCGQNTKLSATQAKKLLLFFLFIRGQKTKSKEVITPMWDKMHDIGKRVYSINGICPTLHTCGGGNIEPKIMLPIKNKQLK